MGAYEGKRMKQVNVTKTFLPPISEYNKYLGKIWSNNQLTNNGPLHKEFEEKTKQYLGVKNLKFVTNGTLALQLAIRSLGITEGEIITTPFSYVATTSAILWENCTPVFVDIDPESLCIDVGKIEAAITPQTKAIMPVHVFGIPCDVEAIEKIAKKHKIKVIYDGAHAFGVKYKGRSLLDFGDVTICSFHATKLFHTIEGGCVIAKDDEVDANVELLKKFGHVGDEHFQLGINAKASEFQAAMGLCNLDYIDSIIKSREKVISLYEELLSGRFIRPKMPDNIVYNNSYFPIVIESEERLLEIVNRLNDINVFPRRYFYPSLNTLPYIEGSQHCRISEDISKRILCLPLYGDLDANTIKRICDRIC